MTKRLFYKRSISEAVKPTEPPQRNMSDSGEESQGVFYQQTLDEVDTSIRSSLQLSDGETFQKSSTVNLQTFKKQPRQQRPGLPTSHGICDAISRFGWTESIYEAVHESSRSEIFCSGGKYTTIMVVGYQPCLLHPSLINIFSFWNGS